MRGAALGKIREAGPFRLGLQVARPVPDHIIRRQQLAIVKFDIGPELERIGKPVGGGLEALGKQRLDFAAIVVADEPLDDMQNDTVGIAVAVHARIVAAKVGTLRNSDIARRCDMCQCEHGRACEKKLFHCSTLFSVVLRHGANPSQQARDSLPMVSSAIVYPGVPSGMTSGTSSV